MSERHVLSDVSRIGKRTLDLVAGTVRLQNRTNDTTYKLSPEGLERWKNYMFGNTRQGGGGKDQFVRLTGLFQTKKGNWIGRIKVEQFDTIIKLMKDAHSRNGTLNFVIAPDKSGKPAMSVVVGDEYKPQGNQGGGMFAAPAAAPPQQFSPAPAGPAQAAREVTFGQADVPKDNFDALLESL